MTYATSLALGRQQAFTPSRPSRNFAGRNQNAVTFRTKRRKLGPVSNTVVLIVLALLLGMVYLAQITKTNAFGYRISSLQAQQSQLKEENDNLVVASARLQAVDRVQNSDQAKNLVSVVPSGTVR